MRRSLEDELSKSDLIKRRIDAATSAESNRKDYEAHQLQAENQRKKIKEVFDNSDEMVSELLLELKEILFPQLQLRKSLEPENYPWWSLGDETTETKRLPTNGEFISVELEVNKMEVVGFRCKYLHNNGEYLTNSGTTYIHNSGYGTYPDKTFPRTRISHGLSRESLSATLIELLKPNALAVEVDRYNTCVKSSLEYICSTEEIKQFERTFLEARKAYMSSPKLGEIYVTNGEVVPWCLLEPVFDIDLKNYIAGHWSINCDLGINRVEGDESRAEQITEYRLMMIGVSLVFDDDGKPINFRCDCYQSNVVAKDQQVARQVDVALNQDSLINAIHNLVVEQIQLYKRSKHKEQLDNSQSQLNEQPRKKIFGIF